MKDIIFRGVETTRGISDTSINQRPIEEIITEFKNHLFKRLADSRIHTEVLVEELEVHNWLRTTLEERDRQADERLREVVGAILDKRTADVVYTIDIIKTAEEHNIDITPNTP